MKFHFHRILYFCQTSVTIKGKKKKKERKYLLRPDFSSTSPDFRHRTFFPTDQRSRRRDFLFRDPKQKICIFSRKSFPSSQIFVVITVSQTPQLNPPTSDPLMILNLLHDKMNILHSIKFDFLKLYFEDPTV